jgi:putative transposase
LLDSSSRLRYLPHIMARPLRIEYPGAWYHVMNRGRRKEVIFSDRKDYENFLAVLRESSEMFGVRIAAYCLMPNHYHLLLQTPFGNLSRAMRHVNGVYTQRYNRRRDIDGQLFRGRYKSVLVEGDSHLLELLRYIHRNPLRAIICTSVEEYPWSSHHGYVSRARKWDWLYREVLLNMFADQPGKAQQKYLEFVRKKDSSEVTDFFSRKNLASVYGSLDFINWIKGKFYQTKNHAEIPQSRILAPTIAEIKTAVGRSYKVDENVWGQSRRGKVNEPRNIAVYLARKHSGLRLEEIGREFGFEKYSSVSSIVVRTEKLLAEDTNLRKRLETIRRKLEKSQAKT